VLLSNSDPLLGPEWTLRHEILLCAIFALSIILGSATLERDGRLRIAATLVFLGEAS